MRWVMDLPFSSVVAVTEIAERSPATTTLPVETLATLGVSETLLASLRRWECRASYKGTAVFAPPRHNDQMVQDAVVTVVVFLRLVADAAGVRYTQSDDQSALATRIRSALGLPPATPSAASGQWFSIFRGAYDDAW